MPSEWRVVNMTSLLKISIEPISTPLRKETESSAKNQGRTPQWMWALVHATVRSESNGQVADTHLPSSAALRIK